MLLGTDCLPPTPSCIVESAESRPAEIEGRETGGPGSIFKASLNEAQVYDRSVNVYPRLELQNTHSWINSAVTHNSEHLSIRGRHYFASW